MKKTPLYTYIGTNGTITSPVHLEGIYFILKYNLEADANKVLTKDGKTYVKSILIPEDELDQWREIYPRVNS